MMKKEAWLAPLTSVGIGGACLGIFLPKTNEELVDIVEKLQQQNLPYKVIGNGTNLLFSDDFHPFFVISTRKITKKMSKKDNFVKLSSSTTLFEAYQFCMKNGLSGFEKLCSIPGNIGGAIASGASCYGCSIFDYLEKLTIFQRGKIVEIGKNKIDCGYHHSEFLKNNFLSPTVILSAKFKLQKDQPCKIQKTYLDICSKRRLSQPAGKSYGCTFKNPEGQSAGFLLEKSGLKGQSCGGAKISEKHANFIINSDSARFEDFEYLINLARKKVEENFGITLENDVEIIK